MKKLSYQDLLTISQTDPLLELDLLIPAIDKVVKARAVHSAHKLYPAQLSSLQFYVGTDVTSGPVFVWYVDTEQDIYQLEESEIDFAQDDFYDDTKVAYKPFVRDQVYYMPESQTYLQHVAPVTPMVILTEGRIEGTPHKLPWVVLDGTEAHPAYIHASVEGANILHPSSEWNWEYSTYTFANGMCVTVTLTKGGKVQVDMNNDNLPCVVDATLLFHSNIETQPSCAGE